MSSKKNQLEIAEEAYSASLQIDKVKYLQHIKVFQRDRMIELELYPKKIHLFLELAAK